MQVIFVKERLINYRALLQKMTYIDKVSYESSPPCSELTLFSQFHVREPTLENIRNNQLYSICISIYKCIIIHMYVYIYPPQQTFAKVSCILILDSKFSGELTVFPVHNFKFVYPTWQAFAQVSCIVYRSINIYIQIYKYGVATISMLLKLYVSLQNIVSFVGLFCKRDL